MSLVNFRKICALLGLVGMISIGIGCAKEEELTDGASQTVQAFSVKDYLYRTVGTCDGGNLQFKVLTTSGILLATDPANPFIVGQMDVYLQSDNTYVADYVEYTGDTQSASERLTGSYTIGDNSITLENLGTAEFFELNNKFGLELTFTRDIVTAGLQDQKHIMRSVLRRDGLTTNDEYCGTSSESLR